MKTDITITEKIHIEWEICMSEIKEKFGIDKDAKWYLPEQPSSIIFYKDTINRRE